MTILHRRGAQLHELTITPAGANLYRADWGTVSVWFEAEGEIQDIINAACDAVGKEIA